MFANHYTDVLLCSIDPSFVERRLRTTTKTSVAVHSLLVYRRGLLGIKLAAEFLKQSSSGSAGVEVDPLRLVLTSNTNSFLKMVDDIEDENISIIHRKEHQQQQLLQIDTDTEEQIAVNEDTPPPCVPMETKKEEVQDTGYRSKYLADAEEERHYAQDVQYMKSLLTQIHSFKGVGALERLRRNTVEKFRYKRSASRQMTIRSSASTGSILLIP